MVCNVSVCIRAGVTVMLHNYKDVSVGGTEQAHFDVRRSPIRPFTWRCLEYLHPMTRAMVKKITSLFSLGMDRSVKHAGIFCDLLLMLPLMWPEPKMIAKYLCLYSPENVFFFLWKRVHSTVEGQYHQQSK